MDTEFDYRQALKKSRLSTKYYVFSEKKFSEVDILKTFKRAARQSESIQIFVSSLIESKMDSIEVLDYEDVSLPYTIFRRGTLNEFLRKLESSLSTF